MGSSASVEVRGGGGVVAEAEAGLIEPNKKKGARTATVARSFVHVVRRALLGDDTQQPSQDDDAVKLKKETTRVRVENQQGEHCRGEEGEGGLPRASLSGAEEPPSLRSSSMLLLSSSSSSDPTATTIVTPTISHNPKRDVGTTGNCRSPPPPPTATTATPIPPPRRRTKTKKSSSKKLVVHRAIPLPTTTTTTTSPGKDSSRQEGRRRRSRPPRTYGDNDLPIRYQFAGRAVGDVVDLLRKVKRMRCDPSTPVRSKDLTNAAQRWVSVGYVPAMGCLEHHHNDDGAAFAARWEGVVWHNQFHEKRCCGRAGTRCGTLWRPKGRRRSGRGSSTTVAEPST